MSAFIPTALPLRRHLRTSNHETPRCAIDTEAPPASRYKTYYPPPCFEAPYLSFLTSSDVPLINQVGVVRQEVPLDLEEASAVLDKIRAEQAVAKPDPSILFSGPATDPLATDPAEKYYPAFRRDEVPVIEITPAPTESAGTVTVAVGRCEATPAADEVAQLGDVKVGSAWNQGPSLSAQQVIDMYYGSQFRNKAPVIEIAKGELAVSMAMKDILGQPDAPLYPEETRFMAPKIDIKKPKGDWDGSAFVNVSMEEVQLPVIAAAVLKVGN